MRLVLKHKNDDELVHFRRNLFENRQATEPDEITFSKFNR